jgi:hypothetical protein
VSVDRLKPHLGEGPVSPASPPARGRPPAAGGGSSASTPSYPVASAGGGWRPNQRSEDRKSSRAFPPVQ